MLNYSKTITSKLIYVFDIEYFSTFPCDSFVVQDFHSAPARFAFTLTDGASLEI